MWLGEAGRGWVTVAVGCQLGSQLGYRASREPAGTQPPPRACEDIYDEPVNGEERLHRDVDARADSVHERAAVAPRRYAGQLTPG